MSSRSLSLLASLIVLPILPIASAEFSIDNMPITFRCVMDQNTRVLFIRLNKTTAIAYDTGRCQMIKVWKDKNGKLINLQGPVFNGKHGKQPTSTGDLIVAGSPLFKSAAGKNNLQLKYIGHKISNVDQANFTTLLYSLRDSADHEIGTIEETPALKNGIVQRSIKINLHKGSSISFGNGKNQSWIVLDTGKKLTPMTITKSTQLTLTHTL